MHTTDPSDEQSLTPEPQWIEWPNRLGRGLLRAPVAPAIADLLVAAVGVDLAAEVCLRMGGLAVYIGEKKGGYKQGALRSIVGEDGYRAISQEMDRREMYLRDTANADFIRIPLANRFLARHLFAQGHKIMDIAVTLRSSVLSVRRWLALTPAEKDIPQPKAIEAPKPVVVHTPRTVSKITLPKITAFRKEGE